MKYYSVKHSALSQNLELGVLRFWVPVFSNSRFPQRSTLHADWCTSTLDIFYVKCATANHFVLISEALVKEIKLPQTNRMQLPGAPKHQWKTAAWIWNRNVIKHLQLLSFLEPFFCYKTTNHDAGRLVAFDKGFIPHRWKYWRTYANDSFGLNHCSKVWEAWR